MTDRLLCYHRPLPTVRADERRAMLAERFASVLGEIDPDLVDPLRGSYPVRLSDEEYRAMIPRLPLGFTFHYPETIAV